MTRAQLQLLVALIVGLLVLAVPLQIAGFISFVFVVVLASATGLLMLIAAWGLEPRRRWREWRVPSQ